MLNSDDFGLDDDDTEFLAAATQIAAVQHASDFRPSPRPTKRQRREPCRSDGEDADETDWSVTSDEAGEGQSLQHVTAPRGQIQGEDGESYYTPGELGLADDAGKTSRFKIYQPADGGKFPDMIVSQTQHHLDQDPTAFRGAVWKRPPAPACSTRPSGTMRRPMNSNGNPRPALPTKGITNYFQSAGSKSDTQGDAALAARLQQEEDSYSRQTPSLAQPGSRLEDEISFDLPQDFDGLLSDAIALSPDTSAANHPIEISSSQPVETQPQRPSALRGPHLGLKQMTIFGKAATQALTTTQAAKKKHAWPLSSKDEPPTHHKLDENAMMTWVYPTNLGATRDYQYNIVSRSLFHNTLVALPTGLGKTFIAATVMLNYYRWCTDAQIVFVAPTKPLIAQQMDACYHIVGIPRHDTVLMTGETSPAIRADEWLERRVFFMTPQTVVNDLKTGICDPKKIVLLVVDEAHKATGGYAYTEVTQFLRRFNTSFRVLALTATPGSTVEAVQGVIDNLGISRVELRTEQSIDIREYTHEKQTETQLFDLSEEQSLIMGLFSRALQSTVDKLSSQNAYWSKDPMNLTAYGLTQARQKWMGSEAGKKAPQPIKGMLNAAFTILSSLAHSISLLKFHGIGPFYSGVLNFQKAVDSGDTKGKTATAIAHHADFVKMMSTLRAWTNKPEFMGHPKMEYLREVVLGHFLDAGEGRQGSDVPPSATRVMVFASYRDSTEEICRVLKRNTPMIRPHVFVGQAASKDSEGMNQKRQNEVIQDFKSGKYNTLIATSIGEEGLDIGTVDLIVCYDASSSPIRMLQRIGRTGRKRLGRVVLLLMSGKEERDYEKAQDNYNYIQKTIADESRYNYRDDQSPRILPKHIKPVVDKHPVEIPVENSQAIDLNEKSKKGRGKGKTKRPAKKFHMPDNVRTGFVRASRLGSDDDDASLEEMIPKNKTATKHAAATTRKTPSFPMPAVAAMPFLDEVLLTPAQQQELQRKYARTSDIVQDPTIHAPDPSRYPDTLRNLGPTKYTGHGRKALVVQNAMQAAHDIDDVMIRSRKDALQMSDLETVGPAHMRLVLPSTKEPNRPVAVEVAKRPPDRPKQVSPNRRVPNLDVSDSEPGPDPIRNAPPVKRVSGPSRAPRTIVRQAEARQKAALEPQSDMPPPAVPCTSKPTKPRGRPRKKQTTRQISPSGLAEEGTSSSPEPTPADMRIGTQGIDLGSRDTSGEDEEESPDSELEDFIAQSSDPIEYVSSSLPSSMPARGKRRRLAEKRVRMTMRSLADVEEVASQDDMGSEDDVSGGRDKVAQGMGAGRKRRVVDESESDE